MSNYNPAPTPMSTAFSSCSDLGSPIDQKKNKEHLGALLFLSTRSRPDISHAAGMLCGVASSPCEAHWTAFKRVLRYLKATAKFGLYFKGRDEETEALMGYCDSDWAGDISSRRSTTGLLIKLDGISIECRTLRQNCVALSSTEPNITLFAKLERKWNASVVYWLSYIVNRKIRLMFSMIIKVLLSGLQLVFAMPNMCQFVATTLRNCTRGR